MAKNNHSRIQGFHTFHLIQRKNYDLYCFCVCEYSFLYALVYEYSDRNPTRALDQATATQTVTTLS